MDEEKRKRLEILKMKNQSLKNELTKISASDYTSNASSNIIPPSVAMLKKESIKTTDLNLEEIKKNAGLMKGVMNKYRTEILSTFFMSESFLGLNPEAYEEGVQCDIDKELKTQSDDENKVKPKAVSFRKSIMPSRNKSSLSPWAKLIGDNIGYKEDDANMMKAVPEEKEEWRGPLKAQVKTMPEETRRQILTSHELNEFMSNKAKYMERALGEKEIYDMFKVYYDEEDNIDPNLLKSSWVTPAFDFYDEETCKGRAVTSMDWSLKHQELLLAAYTKSDGYNFNQSNGLIYLWSLAMRKHPEFTLTCQTEVTSAIFHKFNPKLVIGATYTGQILMWDTRGKSLPIQKTPPSGKFHSYPIYCLGVTGTNNANHIISVSNDGTLCTWSMSNLSKPTKRIELKAKKKKYAGELEGKLEKTYTEDIGAICLATQEGETNNIFLGSDDSDIYQVGIHQGNENADNIVEVYKKHTGPINSLHLHPGDSHKVSNFSNLLLSASADWTVNIWSKTFSEAPLFTFDSNDDYVYDAKFHPTNPSLFACVDGLGKLDFWDLNKDVEVPVYSYEVGKYALNKLHWSHDGKRCAVGDVNGKVSMFNIDKELHQSKVEDSLKFEKLISFAKNSKQGGF